MSIAGVKFNRSLASNTPRVSSGPHILYTKKFQWTHEILQLRGCGPLQKKSEFWHLTLILVAFFRKAKRRKSSGFQLGRFQQLISNFCSRIDTSRAQEADAIISRLEADKSKLSGQILELKRDLSSRDSQSSSLEGRIEQRNSQLIDLQEQINQKCIEMSDIERDVSGIMVMSDIKRDMGCFPVQ